MQVLNFIPEDYLRRKLLRKANLLCALLAAVVGVALGVMFVAGGLSEERLEQERLAVEATVAQAAGGVAQWEKLQADQSATLEQAEKAARLLNPLPRSRVLAEIVRLLPERVLLTSLIVADESVKVIDPVLSRGGTAEQRAVANAKPQIKDQQETRLQLQGLAPTDVEVAQLIAGLSNAAYFSQVELSFSEDQPGGGQTLRRFEIVFRLSDAALRGTTNGRVATAAKASAGGRL